MKSIARVDSYRQLTDKPVWRLLRSQHAAVILGLLHAHLADQQRSLPASILTERVERDLELLRARGYELAQTAQAYIADWLSAGYLERRFPADASEEEYELTAPALQAIRFAEGLADRRTAATESRLAGVIQQLVNLAEQTDPNPASRIEKLQAERDRIDAQIERIQRGELDVLEEDRALERAREVVALTDELANDFRQVRDDFAELNRQLREQIVENEGGRGEVLEQLFAGIDVIGESESGRTFNAFWQLLNNPEQALSLEQALEQILSRPFADKLNRRERKFLLRLTHTLLERSGAVNEVLTNFARSLNNFVQSEEYLEQRHLKRLLKDAQKMALEAREHVRPADNIGMELYQSRARLDSLSRWRLYDPSRDRVEGRIDAATGSDISLEMVEELVSESEIDFRTLRANIRALLRNQSLVSIADLLRHFPAEQGLGSVIGYIALAVGEGHVTELRDSVRWTGGDGAERSARVPRIYFTREVNSDST